MAAVGDLPLPDVPSADPEGPADPPLPRSLASDPGPAPSPGPVGENCRTSAMPKVAGFELKARIGKGGMGEVYLARQLTLNRPVALKFLMPEGTSYSETHLARFHREAELMAQVSHPNVLSVFDFGEADGRPYLVMEYVEGGDLRGRMRAGKPMPPDQVAGIVLPVGEALAYLHRRGIIHRDLKPENILVHDGDHPRVADFGIAVLRAGAASALTETGISLGTPGYIAPEQQSCGKVDERVDQYSLAALAYEMLTGQLPLGHFQTPSQLVPRLGPGVDAVLLRGLCESPGGRYPTVREFAVELCRALAGPPAAGRPPVDRRLAWAALPILAVAAAFLLRPAPDARHVGPGHAAPVSPVRPPSPPTSVARAPLTPEARRALEDELKKMRARKIWEARGSPAGAAGVAVREEIWFEAERSVDDEVKRLAYDVWVERGSPTGAAGVAASDANWVEAQLRLYKQMSGNEFCP